MVKSVFFWRESVFILSSTDSPSRILILLFFINFLLL
jgi:hypothetical protein